MGNLLTPKQMLIWSLRRKGLRQAEIAWCFKAGC